MPRKRNEYQLGDAIEHYLNRNDLRRKAARQRILQDWPLALVPAIAEKISYLSEYQGNLIVWLKPGIASEWNQELHQHRGNILNLLHEWAGMTVFEDIRIFVDQPTRTY
jgi:hypothetical protein